ncbi:MAG: cupin domain-containing protein [Ottowia sp.]
MLCHSGQGELHLQGVVHRFGPGTSVLVPRNAPHQIFNVGDEPMHITAALAAARVEVIGPDDQTIALPW